MKKIIAYKVLKENGIGLYSASGLGKIIKYKKRGWTNNPKGCGPLAVFKTIEDAHYFYDWTGRRLNRIIYKCEIIRSRFRSLWFFKEFSYFLDGKKKKQSCSKFPGGTLLADKVKLLEEVW